MAAALLFLVGLAAVVAGAELVVRGGARVAARLGVSPLIIGLTVVAIGTSFPELAVGIDSALQGNGALAVGNIAGTNTFNLLFISITIPTFSSYNLYLLAFIIGGTLWLKAMRDPDRP